jgi:hypothetical protein
LHAARLRLRLRDERESRTFEAALPAELTRILERLRTED